MLALVEVYPLLGGVSGLESPSALYFLQRLALLVLALFSILHGVAGLSAQRLLVNTHVGWLEELAASRACYLETADLRLVEIHLRRLLDHVVESA